MSQNKFLNEPGPNLCWWDGSFFVKHEAILGEPLDLRTLVGWPVVLLAPVCKTSQ